MSLPKQGTRTVEVAAQTFRWAVGSEDGLPVLVTELAENPGQYVLVNLPNSAYTVTPAFVRKSIQTALEQGWTPAAPGAPLRFQLHNGEVVPAHELHWDPAVMALVRRPKS
jgi:hypothetical protein